MEYRQRKLIAAAILLVSLIVIAYLLFFTPSESKLETPVPVPTTQTSATVPAESSPIDSASTMWTQIPSLPETDAKRTAEAEAADQDLSPEAPETTEDGSETAAREMAPMPEWMSRVQSTSVNPECPDQPTRQVDVSTADQLHAALQDAQPGDRIVLADGTYDGNFVLAASGDDQHRIWVCGSKAVVIDSGGIKNGYGVQITGSYAGLWGITVSNAQKGIVIDGGDFVTIDSVEVHTIGDEGIHFRGNATDGVVQDCLVHYTGLRREKFGEGVYVGSAVSNWEQYRGGEPDKSDRVTIAGTRIWDTSAESVDIKEGTSGGMVQYNFFDGTGMSGADSWLDMKGNGYLVQGNVGVSAPEDGFQTHNIDDLGYGSDNTFIANTAQVDGPGYGFYIHDPDKTNNTVSCTNTVTKAESGFSNIPCSEPTQSRLFEFR